MRTAEQRAAAVHRRTEELRRRREKSMLFLTAVCSCILLAVLVPLTARLAGPSAEDPGDVFTGAALLDESAGGYLLAAVLSFMAGITVTVLCIKYRDRSRKPRGSNRGAEQVKKPDPHPENKGE